MNLTFKGYIKNYCRELSGQDSLALTKLFNLAQTECSSLYEPIFVLACCLKSEDYLLRITKGTAWHKEYEKRLKEEKKFDCVIDYLKSEKVPNRYKGVYNSYLQKFDNIAADRRICEGLRKKILEIIDEGNMSRYQIFKSLKLNKGNFYAYLAGDNTKVSKDTAYKILDFVTSKAN